jgi:hypothetical protein
MLFLMRLSKHQLISAMIIVVWCYTGGTAQAQGKITSDREWLVFASTSTMTYEYDKNTVQRMDSTHILIRIKETPKTAFYRQVKSDKMMEHRSLQDYEDRSHLIFDYEGYEKYAYTMREDEFDQSMNRFTILETTDYDTNGAILFQKKTAVLSWTTSLGAVPETAVSQLFSK